MSRKLELYLTMMSICTAWVGVFTFGVWLAWAQADSGLVPKGEKVYGDKRCAACHMINGKGGKMADDLTSVGSKRDAAWLNKFMKDPKSIDSSNKMPAFRGSDEELEAVVAYMTSLK